MSYVLGLSQAKLELGPSSFAEVRQSSSPPLRAYKATPPQYGNTVLPLNYETIGFNDE